MSKEYLTVKLQQFPNGQYVITLPKRIVQMLNLEKGDKLAVGLTGEHALSLTKLGEPHEQ
jgi:antitoxin component of MazEF toxin-antitoxin module